MKWSTIQLQKFRDKSFDIDESIDIAHELMEMDPEIRGASLFRITGKGSVSADKVTFQFHIAGKLVLPCSRTLVDVDYPLDMKSTETFLLKPAGYAGLEDEEVHVAENEVIDLIPIIKELILLEIPMQVLSEEAKKGELPHTKDWQVVTEDQYQDLAQQQKPAVDPRLAGLAKLLDQDSKE
ncbi:YceD family protein [Heyndrickxia acidiproducens]|uniref:YceD family protein n=1 Tax=Heyndrickxia acidiproducens TaxID=1121084 RepID=UPI000381C8B7|nr:YceD family protein [Heyndrickxia acidiproducens]